MINMQAPERISAVDENHLEVVEVWRTIQGEGPFAGQPATFVRLAGCNIRCPFCDTNYTQNRIWCSVDELVNRIRTVAYPSDLVVITGGEPFRQDLRGIVKWLIRLEYHVQIETNGTIYRKEFFQEPLSRCCTIVCSPKGPIAEELAPHIRAYKYVVQADLIGDDGFPKVVLGKGVNVARPPAKFPKNRIYIQPCDEGDHEVDKKHMQAAVDVCMKHGFMLCLQMHKIAGLK